MALLIGFIVSGLIHDLVISLPAQGGWGLPTLYFTIQGVAILLERSSFGRGWGLGRGLVGWCFTAAVLILPCTLLFHPPFLVRVINPFLVALGAGS
jgi:alginate O-acetyltransferase complex protein AlgI